MEKRHLTCIRCPMGCQIEVTLDGGEVLSVQGNSCPRGELYARKEVTAPTRTVTSTVRVTGSTDASRTVSCKTAEDVPKEKVLDVVRELAGVTVSAPVRIGDVIVANAAGTGVNVVATKTVS